MRLPMTSWRVLLTKLGLARSRAPARRRQPRRLLIEDLTQRRMLAGDLNPLDLNTDALVTANDAVVIVCTSEDPSTGRAPLDVEGHGGEWGVTDAYG